MYNKIEIKNYKKGEYSHKWKGGKPKCLDCNKITTQYTSKRCRECFVKFQKGKNAGNYKGVKININCTQCKNQFSAYYKAKFCSQKCFGEYSKIHYRGEKIYNYKKDRTQLKDDSKERGGQLHREWSNSVKIRDGGKCKINNSDCKGRLEAHHILGWTKYSELRYEITNGITLCHFHHPRKREDEINLSPYFKELVMNIK